MPIKILATADLHLGKSSADVNGSHVATRHTWDRIIDWAITAGVDVMVLSGDIVDRDNRFFEAVGILQSGFDRLLRHQIEVYLVSGNHDHDVLPQLLRGVDYPNVHLIGEKGTWEMLTFSKYGQTLQLVGWSFPRLLVNESAMKTWEIKGYDPTYPLIGLLHGDADNLKSNYNPFRVDELVKSEVDLWILGHIHKPAQLRSHSPQIWYTGSPHAMSAKEPGEHSALLFTIDSSKNIQVEKIPLSPVRYEHLEVDVSSCNDESELRDCILNSLKHDTTTRLSELENVKSMVYQIALVGRHQHIKQIEQWASSATDLEISLVTDTQVTIRRISCRIMPAIGDLQELAQQNSLAGILASTIQAIQMETSTPFLEMLLVDWRNKATSMHEASTYAPLRAKLIEPDDEMGRAYVLNECSRLLGELMDQTKHSN